ncbi:retrovirus-related Pol polyprotein from transposon 17.6 [Trichonephila clavipes]|nr:retrovirus-related Pol polyprotein from transposon 17.6 [Trichonephila clavipes]
MECRGLLSIFQRSETSRKACYTQYLGDGDSKGFLTIKEAKVYGDTEVEKLECVGHVQKRMGTRLRNILKTSKGIKLSDGKNISGRGRLTLKEVDSIQRYYGLAIRKNLSSVEDMKRAIWAIYFHKLSTEDNPQHALCPLELAEELGLIVEASLTKPKLKDLIVKSPDYIEDDVKVMIDSIVKDRIRTEEKEEKLRREEREYELEKLRIQAEMNANTMNNPENVQAPKDWVQKLIGLIPIDIAYLIAGEPVDKCNDYNHVKRLLLKRSKLSPEKLRQLFISHRKSNERTWEDFFYEIQTYFDGWISGLNVETFDQLRELIIADQIKSAPYELREHFLDKWSTINSPAEIAEKFEEYENVRRTLRPRFYNSFAKGGYEASGSSDTYFQRTEYLQGGSNRRERKNISN